MDADLTKAYIAGLFDGEGNVQVNGYSSIRVSITNSVLAPLELVQFVYGGRFHLLKKIESHHKQLYRWHTSKKPIVKRFILDLLPFSLIKTNQLKLALMFYDRSRGEDVEVYIEAMKILNSGSKENHNEIASSINTFQPKIV